MSRPEEPLDPFAGDPDDPAKALAALDDDAEGDHGHDAVRVPLSPAAREGALDDLADLEVFEALLAPRGVRGLLVDCDSCREVHALAWDLLRGSLRDVLDRGTPRVHEPALSPDLDAYVTWDYAQGFLDATLAADEEG